MALLRLLLKEMPHSVQINQGITELVMDHIFRNH
jgi:hypothetical protein